MNYLAVSGIHEPYNKHNNNPININIISNYPLKIIKSLPENIQKRIYKPLIYNINSNHPPKTIKNLPKNIQKRISKTQSSSIRIFNNSKDLFNNVLSASRFQQRIRFEQHKTSATPRKNRKSNIIWFNPPYSANVTTQIGNKFLEILDKYFPKSHKYHKILNCNNAKVSYNSLPNFVSIINSHNKKILRQEEMASSNPQCNCSEKKSCPLNCLQSSVVYGSKITSDNIGEDSPHYIYGLTENTGYIRQVI